MVTEYRQTLTRRELGQSRRERKMFGVKTSDLIFSVSAIECTGGEFSSASFIGGVSMKSLQPVTRHTESDCKQQSVLQINKDTLDLAFLRLQ